MASNSSSPTKMSLARRQACDPCRAAKQRCDRARGGCSRCRTRSKLVECVFAKSDPSDARNAMEDEPSTIVTDASNLPSNGSSLGISTAIQNTEASRDTAGLSSNMHATNVSFQKLKSNASALVFDTLGTAKDSPNLSTVGDALITSSISDSHEFANANNAIFRDLDLVCTISAEEIRDRWQNQYLPLPGQTPKNYPVLVIGLIARMLKSYTLSAVNLSASMISQPHALETIQSSTLPPFVHWMQLRNYGSSNQLSTCFSLASLCNKPLPPSTVRDMLQSELNRLGTHYRQHVELELLESFQAYLVYAMLIYFYFDEDRDSGLQDVMILMKDIAYEVSREGIICRAEQDNIRPSWEAWIVAEAKRRTLFTMYLFDNLLCTRDGLPTYLGTELRTIPAPSTRLLWYATSRERWQLQYNACIPQWGALGPLRIDELWSAPPQMSKTEKTIRRERVERWSMSLDEFGTMLYAVTSCTHEQ